MLLTSTSYPRGLQDWQGVFIRNIAESLALLPEVELSVWAPPGPLPERAAYACSASEASWLRELAERGGIAQALRRRSVGAALKLLLLLRRLDRRSDADLVHANWLQSALPLAGTRTPLVASVLGTDFALLRLPGMVAALRYMLRQRRAVLAPNAEWMVPRLTELFGDLARVRAVPFGVDAAWFRVEREPVSQPRRWIAVLRVTAAKIGPLFDWGQDVFQGADELHLFGPNQQSLEIPPWVRYHGATHPQALREEWFPRAAGLVTLSRHDEGRPQVLLEAMAAGVPAIVSDIEAHSIADAACGARVSSPEQLAAAVRGLSDAGVNRERGLVGRERVRERMGTWEDCARRYATLYDEVLA